MQLYEYIGNLHMHTPYSDGEASHEEIAEAAMDAGLDFVVVTDHNVWIDGVEGYYTRPTGERVLLLVGEEVHDMTRSPQVNHMLVYRAEQEMSAYGHAPQRLIDYTNDADGFCFIAHPHDQAAPAFNLEAIPWLDWDVERYTGIELWNYMSEFKSRLTSRTTGVRAILEPDRYIMGPHEETLNLWDNLLKQGHFVKIIGNADAHGTTYDAGPISRVIFPYEFLFRCVNTHVVLSNQLTGRFDDDKKMILNAVRNGHSFVGYDYPASTKGFRFTAQGHNFSTYMGSEIKMGHGVTLQMASPRIADMRLYRDGDELLREVEGTHRTYIANRPGMYRVEVYIEHKGQPRGWIFSNPIHVFK